MDLKDNQHLTDEDKLFMLKYRKLFPIDVSCAVSYLESDWMRELSNKNNDKFINRIDSLTDVGNGYEFMKGLNELLCRFTYEEIENIQKLILCFHKHFRNSIKEHSICECFLSRTLMCATMVYAIYTKLFNVLEATPLFKPYELSVALYEVLMKTNEDVLVISATNLCKLLNLHKPDPTYHDFITTIMTAKYLGESFREKVDAIMSGQEHVLDAINKIKLDYDIQVDSYSDLEKEVNYSKNVISAMMQAGNLIIHGDSATFGEDINSLEEYEKIGRINTELRTFTPDYLSSCSCVIPDVPRGMTLGYKISENTIGYLKKELDLPICKIAMMGPSEYYDFYTLIRDNGITMVLTEPGNHPDRCIGISLFYQPGDRRITKTYMLPKKYRYRLVESYS